jgi:hypothetical protein
MSDKAKRLLKQAVKVYLYEDGAGSGGYKDAIADLLHLARKDKPFLKGYPVWEGKYPSFRYLVDDAYAIYTEERENAEVEKLHRISKKNLPLHIHNEWEFETVRREFEARLKGVPPCSSKDTSTESSSAS